MAKLGVQQGSELVRLARRAIEDAFAGSETRVPAGAWLREKRGVFCTLKSHPLDVLRGCIGVPEPLMPLGEAVVEAATSSAFGDPRFKHLSKEELGRTVVELTVLSKPEELECPKDEMPSRIAIGRHGLIVRRGMNSGLLLPQVPLENGPWSSVEFLEATCWKAGLAPQAWKEEATRVYVFEGQIFSEKEPGGGVEEKTFAGS
ncbi:MAG: TIGR00296 family protein [Candidatus Diapherotrites archaeon]|nr:TIGR00296 family protein [Candidatus Diapherotrites archaeon]